MGMSSYSNREFNNTRKSGRMSKAFIFQNKISFKLYLVSDELFNFSICSNGNWVAADT